MVKTDLSLTEVISIRETQPCKNSLGAIEMNAKIAI
jgi:hypothetical protein